MGVKAGAFWIHREDGYTVKVLTATHATVTCIRLLDRKRMDFSNVKFRETFRIEEERFA